MSIIDTIRAKLQHYPELKYTSSSTSICIEPVSPEGFPVGAEFVNGSFIISFSGWHEHFTDEVEALNFFGLGLSKQCRLRVISRGSVEYRWVFERLKDGKWVEISQTGLLFFPFWRKRSVRIHQNTILDF